MGGEMIFFFQNVVFAGRPGRPEKFFIFLKAASSIFHHLRLRDGDHDAAPLGRLHLRRHLRAGTQRIQQNVCIIFSKGPAGEESSPVDKTLRFKARTSSRLASGLIARGGDREPPGGAEGLKGGEEEPDGPRKLPGGVGGLMMPLLRKLPG